MRSVTDALRMPSPIRYIAAFLAVATIPAAIVARAASIRFAEREIWADYDEWANAIDSQRMIAFISRKTMPDMVFRDDVLDKPRYMGRAELLRELSRSKDGSIDPHLVFLRCNIRFIKTSPNEITAMCASTFREHRQPGSEADIGMDVLDRWVRTPDGWKLQAMRPVKTSAISTN